MKRLLFIGLLAFTFGACSNGGMKQASVPDQVVTAFNQRYPFAEDVKWDTKDGMYKADFEVNGKDKEAFYRADGTLYKVQ